MSDKKKATLKWGVIALGYVYGYSTAPEPDYTLFGFDSTAHLRGAIIGGLSGVLAEFIGEIIL